MIKKVAKQFEAFAQHAQGQASSNLGGPAISNSGQAAAAAQARAGQPQAPAFDSLFGAEPSPQSSSSDRNTVRFGSTGSEVLDLQQMLNERGEQLALDGVFGSLTRAAVTRFQSDNGLDPDGVVGPLTWSALEQAPPTSEERPPLDFAVGDAEGDGDEPERRELETLDRGNSNALADETTSSNTNQTLFGFGGTGDPSVAPVVHASKPLLLSGGFADRGDYRASGDGFIDAELDELLAAYGSFWGIDVRAQPQPDDPKNQPGGGDSAGKGVHLHPPWVKAMQNKIIGRAKWNDDDRASQKLLGAFLRAWTRELNKAAPEGMPPGAEQMFHQIGGSETNGEARGLGGFKGSGNWCAQASSMALIVGMYNRGIRFKGGTPSTKFGPEMTRQISRFSAWSKSGTAGVGGKAAFTAPVEPGDIISVVNGGAEGPLSGHVATVIKEEGDKIFYVSGNAAGVQSFEGSVRVEEVTREQPPNGYDWLEVGGRGNDYAKLKQQASAENKKADVAADESQQKVVFIFANLPADLAGVTDLNQLLAILIGRPDVLGQQALIGNISEVLIAQGKATAHRAAANALMTKRAGMETDNSGLPVNRADSRFRNNPGKFAPIDPTHSWVVSIIKSSGLTKAAMLGNKQVGLEPNDEALEQGPTLAEQCPDAPPELLN